MAAPNTLAQVYAALWAAVEANATITAVVKPGNRVKYAAAGRVPPKILTSAKGGSFAPADFPLIIIRQGGRQHRYNRSSTFGRCALAEEIVIHWLLSLTFDDLTIDNSTPVEDALDDVLAAAWMNRLGIPALVTNIEDVSVRVEETDRRDAGGTFRRVVTWDIPTKVAIARHA